MATRASSIRRKISVEARYRAYEADEYQCVYCGADLRDVQYRERTLDHLRPIASFPRWQKPKVINAFQNIVTCCLSCNGEYGDAAVKIARHGRFKELGTMERKKGER